MYCQGLCVFFLERHFGYVHYLGLKSDSAGSFGLSFWRWLFAFSSNVVDLLERRTRFSFWQVVSVPAVGTTYPPCRLVGIILSLISGSAFDVGCSVRTKLGVDVPAGAV